MNKLRPLRSLTLQVLILLVSQGALADCPGPETPFPAGIADEFAPPPEPTQPSPELLAYMLAYWPQPPTRQFDMMGSDFTLIHSFSGWSGPVCGARLEIRLAAGEDGLTYNDSVRLSWVGGPDLVHAFRYWTTIGNVIGSWGPGDVVTLVLDLSALPPFQDFPTDILEELADGGLELAVEDDTAVDYAILYICDCATGGGAQSWAAIKSLYRGGPSEREQP